jgi:hypothetical protein
MGLSRGGGRRERRGFAPKRSHVAYELAEPRLFGRCPFNQQGLFGRNFLRSNSFLRLVDPALS